MAKEQKNEKALEKMTSKELREVALGIPEISGVHGMNKPELVSVIKKSRGVAEKEGHKSSNIRELKKLIKELKVKRAAALKAKDSKNSNIYKRKISKLKKKTRRAA